MFFFGSCVYLLCYYSYTDRDWRFVHSPTKLFAWCSNELPDFGISHSVGILKPGEWSSLNYYFQVCSSDNRIFYLKLLYTKKNRNPIYKWCSFTKLHSSVQRFRVCIMYCVRIILGISKIGKKCENISIIKSNSIEFVEMVSIVRIRNKVWQQRSPPSELREKKMFHDFQHKWIETINWCAELFFVTAKFLQSLPNRWRQCENSRERRTGPRVLELCPVSTFSVRQMIISNGKKAIQWQKKKSLIYKNNSFEFTFRNVDNEILNTEHRNGVVEVERKHTIVNFQIVSTWEGNTRRNEEIVRCIENCTLR